MQESSLRGFPLSPQQRRLWLLERSATGTLLRTAGRVRVTGPVDAERLCVAIEAVAARHEILRTTFRLLSGMTMPLQVINAVPRVSFERVEEGGSMIPPLDAEPFDLADGRLPRVRLTRLAAAEHLLELALPSLCCDAEGMALLVAEIAARYAGDEVPDDPTQYADFAQWQNDQLEAEETAAQRELWRRLAPAVRGAARLPVAAPAETARSSRPERLAADLEPETVRSLQALAARTGTSLERVLLAAWQALLLRLTGGDVIVAAAFTGRTYDELSDALGPYVRYLPLRLTASADSSFTAVLAQVHELAEDFAQLQDAFTFADLEAEIDGERVTAHLPFAFDAAPALRSWQAGDVAFELTDLVSDMDQFEARLSYRETGGHARIELHHDPALLGRDEASLLLDRLLALLASAAARPESRLADLQLLGSAEQRRLLEMNQTRQDYGPVVCLHELFAEQARATPDAVALVAEGESLTYAELSERVRLLAAHLAGLGIVPESRVALLLDRSPAAVTAILAVLTAGGAYVPLDPDHPSERLAFLLADARPTVLLTTTALIGRVPESAMPVVCLDRNLDSIPAADLQTPGGPRATPDNLAYVIYTSGSTGAPKGVMVAHRAIANRILWMRAALPVGAEDRVALKTLLGFDAAIWEIFLPLISGACLVLARPDGHRDSSYLADLVATEKITVLQLVPSMLGAFLEEPRVREGLPLRRFFCGGEALPAERVRRFQELLPAAELHNLYGPTESSIDATHWACGPENASGMVPIGSPIGNVRVHVTDQELRLAPLGVGGELCIGGAGLARGYNGRPDLTADRFIPDPFSGEPGSRLYRTGDLARVLRDGVVEFLGRLDHQVKIRGYRIELGEIESVLLGHAAVREAVVAVREHGGDRRLIAYVVPRPGEEEPAAAELRAFLEERLPEYMVPAGFVSLEALPLMANGKVNRQALPEPPETAGALVEAVAPRTLVEDLLAGIWADLLGTARISVQDDFFALGGHSLLATQVASRIRASLRIDVPLRTLLAHPTVAAQAVEVEAILAGRRGLEAPPIVPVPRDRSIPLSFAQQRLWIVQQLDPASAAFNIPLAVRMQGRLDLAAVAWSFTEIHRRHEVLRTTFIEVERQPVQRIAPAADPQMVLIDLQPVSEERRSAAVDEIVRDELSRPFDLQRGPLQRIVLVRLSLEEHVAVLTTHHSVSDAWSTGILIRELAALYRAHGEGLPSPLPELPVQYADFAWWQRQWLQGEVLEAHLDFWRHQLEGAPPLLALPTDRPRPAVATPHGRVRPHLFAEGLGDRLRATSRREGSTVFMLLLAGFYALLRHLTGEDDLVVGTDVANRNRIETEPLIGFFVNQLVLRARVPAEGSFRDLLEQVRETTLETYAHQDVPFDKLVEVLRPERNLAYAPVFQVKLNVQNVPAQVLEVPGLTLAPLDFTSTTSQLDLVVNVVDDGVSFYGTIHYNTDLFLAETIGDWWADYEKVLSAVADRPEISLAELGEMLAAERQGRQAERERQLEQASLDRLKRGRRSAVRVPAGVTPADGF